MKRPDDALALLDRQVAPKPAPAAAPLAQGDTGHTGSGCANGVGADRPWPAELSEKGRLLDQLDRHDKAWAAFVEGKRIARELTGNAYLDQLAGELINRLRGFFVSGRLALLPRAGVRTDVPQPIFVLGFPRSGTTLVEQTLSAHPAISSRRRAAADQRHHQHHAAHAEQPADLSRGAGGTMDGRSARRVGQSARLLFAESGTNGGGRARRGVVHRQDAVERDPIWA